MAKNKDSSNKIECSKYPKRNNKLAINIQNQYSHFFEFYSYFKFEIFYDTTIIEIYEDKDGINNFLDLDLDLYEEDFNNKFIGKSIYILQYPKREKVYVSYGIIKSREAKNYKYIIVFI